MRTTNTSLNDDDDDDVCVTQHTCRSLAWMDTNSQTGQGIRSALKLTIVKCLKGIDVDSGRAMSKLNETGTSSPLVIAGLFGHFFFSFRRGTTHTVDTTRNSHAAISHYS